MVPKKNFLALIFLLLFITPCCFAGGSNNERKDSITANDQDSKKETEGNHKQKQSYPWEKLYAKALKYYNKKKYSRAADLFFEIIPLLSSEKDIIEMRYKLACSSYYSKDYNGSIYQFEELFNDYPKSKYAEEALYLHAKSLFLNSPRIELNQDYTEEALLAINYYLDIYPNGKFLEQAEKDKKEMEIKLFEREYYISETYYKLEKYDAAIMRITPKIENSPSEDHQVKAKIFKLNCIYQKALNQKKNYKKRELLVETSEEIIFLQDEHKLSPKQKKEINKLNNKINRHLKKL